METNSTCHCLKKHRTVFLVTENALITTMGTTVLGIALHCLYLTVLDYTEISIVSETYNCNYQF